MGNRHKPIGIPIHFGPAGQGQTTSVGFDEHGNMKTIETTSDVPQVEQNTQLVEDILDDKMFDEWEDLYDDLGYELGEDPRTSGSYSVNELYSRLQEEVNAPIKIFTDGNIDSNKQKLLPNEVGINVWAEGDSDDYGGFEIHPHWDVFHK